MIKTRFFLTGLMFMAIMSCVEPSELKLNVMTFNIRYDNPADSLNAWNNRKEFAASCISFYEADIVGLQEAQHHQIEDLKRYLSGYESLGVGRIDGKTKGEYSAIIYKKDRFEVLDSRTFWLSENPDAIGIKGWDAACERIVTWGHFKDKQTGKDVYFVNTHFDHIGQIARRESSKLLLSKLKEICKDKPVIVTGDFNSVPTSEAIKILTDKSNPEHLLNTYDLSPVKYGVDWSFHGFGKVPLNRREFIDYIFVRGDIKTLRHGVIYDVKDNGLYLSDHNPVLCTLIF
ncbi:MAG: endonuclease/exonuclease/phosphatase family protein [Prevotellaceae bacterium]|jgi:endonuclease/exonuclease/phosphatase family metal-dependent hydrolase|nr:endonuclease/exonuclease/phosphatase family protein [Prevotellaceae bacterium]